MFKFNLAKLRVSQELGRGSFGAVYPYQKTPDDDDRWVVKVVTSTNDTLPAHVQEIALGFSCKHPNVLPVKGFHLDFDKNDKNLNNWKIYLKVPRMTQSLKSKLDEQIKDNRMLPEDEIIKYFYGISSGIAYLHEQKIPHRDIKLDNLLLDKEGRVKITDMGIRMLMKDESSYFAAEKAGTPLYTAAPEILEAEPSSLKKKDLYQADMWSVGVAMAELCLLQSQIVDAFWSGDKKEKELAKKVGTLEGKYSQTLIELVLSLLRRDPSERKTAEEVKEILKKQYAGIISVELKQESMNMSMEKQKERENEDEKEKKREEEMMVIREELLKTEAILAKKLKENEMLKKEVLAMQKKMHEMSLSISMQVEKAKFLNEEEKKTGKKEVERVELKGNCFQTLQGHKSSVNCLELLPNGQKGQYGHQGAIQRNTNFNSAQNQNPYQRNRPESNYQGYNSQYQMHGQGGYPYNAMSQQGSNAYMYPQPYSNYPQQWNQPYNQQSNGPFPGQFQPGYQGQNQNYQAPVNPGFEKNQIPPQNASAPKISGSQPQNQAGNSSAPVQETQKVSDSQPQKQPENASVPEVKTEVPAEDTAGASAWGRKFPKKHTVNTRCHGPRFREYPDRIMRNSYMQI